MRVRYGMRPGELIRALKSNGIRTSELIAELDAPESTVRRWLAQKNPLSTVVTYAAQAAIQEIVRRRV